ncbi:MAG: pyridine nucleotide-disulfide oxidoreductase [Marinomonas sp.]|jgi:sulfide:quinone oxidoreductase|uniref:NAD(P)/FAD-dependent oxidoreductase n=1 Tax=Marinomonas communis TaxID=28254 RepID=UPI000C614755|nr:FAD/NAD(P)-binding oxidoreductase [Marinomonas communis]MAF16067.1 pyridine nucleotide-disulfide oxidoreductase [Marinomonas sp.]MCC4275319.1 NAD(P)/FAD-dependent oxidoreductase [Marinomonas communis]RUM51187.1 MAG: pyridine nucleotide-disulfide oxidoreductase [Marinomonas sp.]RUM56085.1 MAG: pyridine nucleotide-disulfide oxidoreductase [Marinomonas sp.]
MQNFQHEVVIVGAGAGGVAVAASLLKRRANLNIALIDPAKEHSYQPGWTLVGGGVFQQSQTRRPMSSVIPDGVTHYSEAAATFQPEENCVTLADGKVISYSVLVVSPGLKLNWEAIPGLKETLGKNGVTSNYQWETAPYTWQNVQQLKKGKAIFTQPPMPIKCAGAPQKAMYLSCSEWLSQGVLGDIDVEFCNAGGVLFGVADYVPALMSYIEKYGIELNLGQTLVEVDGDKQVATFEVTNAAGEKERIEKPFDMLHVCPPQCSLDFIKNSPLADDAGWVDVYPDTLQHKKYNNVFGLGDGTNTPNAKTAAAARAQAPVVAENVLSVLVQQSPRALYDGYGSCPLTVERGKIVLAEFVYGGKVKPSFPNWLIDGTKPSYLAWLLKEKSLPWVYWEGMLKGREWLVSPVISNTPPAR